MKHAVTFLPKRLRATLLPLFLLAAFGAQAQQNVGIGTTAPTQTLDVNGNVRVRGLNGSGNRLPVVLPDGTLGVNAPVYGASPSAPPVLAGSAATVAGPLGVAVSGTTAYVVGSNTLQVFDASTPAAPVLVGSVATGTTPFRVAVSGTVAYVINSGSNTLQTFDVSNPAAPALLGTVATGSNPLGLAVNGTTAYVASYSSGLLQVFDCSAPAAPALVGSVATSGASNAVAVSGTTVYVTGYSNTLQVFDASTPAAPVLRGSVAVPGGPIDVAVRGTVVYLVAYSSNTLQTYDVANPAAPALLGSIGTDNFAHGVAVSGTTAYVVNRSSNSLEAFDVTDPAAITLLGRATTGSDPYLVAATSTAAYVINDAGNTLQVFAAPVPPRAVAVNADGSFSSVALPSSGSFVQNQSAVSQPASFRISGNGLVGGSVGIGTATPSQRLDVNGNQNLTGTLQVNTGDVDKIYYTTAGAAGSKLGHASGWGVLNYAGPGSGSQGYQAWLLSGASAYQEQMRLTGTGLGISTTAPLTRLSITPGATEPKITLYDGGSTTNHYGFGVSNSQLNYHVDGTGSSHVFYAGGKNGDGTEVLRIKGDGQVGVGTSSPSGQLANTSVNTIGSFIHGGGGNSLSWAASQAGYVAQFYNGGTAASSHGMVVKIDGTDPGAIALDVSKGAQSTPGTPLLVVKASGNVGIGTLYPSQALEVAGQVFSNTGGLPLPRQHHSDHGRYHGHRHQLHPKSNHRPGQQQLQHQWQRHHRGQQHHRGQRGHRHWHYQLGPDAGRGQLPRQVLGE